MLLCKGLVQDWLCQTIMTAVKLVAMMSHKEKENMNLNHYIETINKRFQSGGSAKEHDCPLINSNCCRNCKC